MKFLMTSMSHVVLAWVFLTWVPGLCLSAEYFMAPYGSDSGDGSISNPWKSLNFVLNKYANDSVNARIKAGDTLYLRGGVYDVTSMSAQSDGRIYIRLNTNVSSPMTYIKSYPGEWAILDGGRSKWSLELKGAMHNVTFEDMEIRNGYRWGFRFGEGYDGRMAYSCIFRNLYFHDNISSDVNDNPAGMQLSCDSCIIENCTFVDNGTPGSGHYNNANLIMYNDYGKFPEPNPRKSNIIRYCVFDGAGAGIKDKGDFNLLNSSSPNQSNSNIGNEIHHNIFLNSVGMAMAVISDFTRLHHNLVINGNGGFRFYTYEMSNGSVWYCKVYNNTFVNMSNYAIAADNQPQIFYSGSYGHDINNNIIYNCTSDAFIFWTGQSSRNFSISTDYNFWNNSVSTVGRRQADSNATLSKWREYGYGTHSNIGSISFVNSNGNDFRLAPGSLGLMAGSDGNDAGAFGEGNWYDQAGYNSEQPPVSDKPKPPVDFRSNN